LAGTAQLVIDFSIECTSLKAPCSFGFRLQTETDVALGCPLIMSLASCVPLWPGAYKLGNRVGKVEGEQQEYKLQDRTTHFCGN